MLSVDDYVGMMTAWAAKFEGSEESLEAAWELAGTEERWGDSRFFGSETGGAAHYHAALRALVPQGAIFSTREENDRRMEACQRVTNKLYAVGPDGKAREAHDARPHPDFRPVVRAKSKAERREAVQRASEIRMKHETGYGRLPRSAGHWEDYTLGDMWHEAARALAPGYPDTARSVCGWSIHYFERYNQAWTAHLPASRWDSDGGREMQEVQELEDSLGAGGTEAPAWVALLLAGDWEQSFTVFAKDANAAPECKQIALLLADACRSAGNEAAARDVLLRFP